MKNELRSVDRESQSVLASIFKTHFKFLTSILALVILLPVGWLFRPVWIEQGGTWQSVVLGFGMFEIALAIVSAGLALGFALDRRNGVSVKPRPDECPPPWGSDVTLFGFMAAVGSAYLLRYLSSASVIPVLWLGVAALAVSIFLWGAMPWLIKRNGLALR